MKATIITSVILLLLLLLFVSSHQLVSAAASPPNFPNIDLVGFGYNIFFGNPEATDTSDPGFAENAAFQVTYNNHLTSSDGLWSIPDGTSVSQTPGMCSLVTDGVTIQTIGNYFDALQTDCSADYSNFAAAFSASEDYKMVQQGLASQSVFVAVKGVCQVYKELINTSKPPGLSTTFVNAVASLPNAFNTSTAQKFWSFFTEYGTHYFTEFAFGARWSVMFESSPTEWSELQSTGLNIQLASGYAGLLQNGVALNNSEQMSEAKTFEQYTSSLYDADLGTPPPNDGDVNAWASQIIHAQTMMPVSYTLATIDQLLTSTFTNNPALLARQPVVYAALLDYCSNYLAPNNFTSVHC